MRAIACATLAMIGGVVSLGACAADEAHPVGTDEARVADDTGEHFCPKQVVTRKDMARYLERMKNGPKVLPDPATGIFDDVPRGVPDEAWIEALFKDGITTGCVPGKSFCPLDAVPREQMAAFIIRLMHRPDFAREPSNRFVDVTGDSVQFSGYIDQLLEDGITTGCDATHFCPKQPVLREQMAAFLMRARHPGPDGPGRGRFVDVSGESTVFAGRIEQAVDEGIMEPCGGPVLHAPSASYSPGFAKAGIPGIDGTAVCEFLCNAVAVTACGYAKNAAELCKLASDKLLCPAVCKDYGWENVCMVTDAARGCTVCCQTHYGCGPEQCAYPTDY